MAIIPIPRLGVDGFADTTQNTERAEVVVFDVVFAGSAEETDGGGSGVVLGEFVLFDDLPVSR